MVALSRAFPIRHARSTRCGSSAGSAASCSSSRVARSSAAPAGLRGGSRSLWVGARVRLDRDQRQPRPAAVLPAGGAGARAGGRRRRRRSRSRRCRRWRAWVVVLVLAVGDLARRRRSVSRSSPPTSGTTRSTLLGRIDRRTHLAQYGGARDVDKYSALDNRDLGAFLASHTAPDETVYVFGFSPGAYVYADRRSASRFFWSRPVILDFNRERSARTGSPACAPISSAAQPAYVVLQQHDWSPDVQDSAPFFLSQPRARRLAARRLSPGVRSIDGFEAWERNGP